MLRRTVADEFGKKNEVLKCSECEGNPFPTHPDPEFAAQLIALWRCKKCGKIICENCGEEKYSRDTEEGSTWDCSCGSEDLEEIPLELPIKLKRS